LRALVLTLALAVIGCAPAPSPMAATEASELLERFAAGASPADVCTRSGRAALRGAVRAYGQEMAQNGIAWPALPPADSAGDHLTRVEAAVLVASASGFLEPSDLRGSARALARETAPAHWPEANDLRRLARVACAEVMQLQLAASRLMVEAERYRDLVARADASASAAEGAQTQARRLERAQAQLDAMAAAVRMRLEANPS
jgi:hypothetical protein